MVGLHLPWVCSGLPCILLVLSMRMHMFEHHQSWCTFTFHSLDIVKELRGLLGGHGIDLWLCATHLSGGGASLVSPRLIKPLLGRSRCRQIFNTVVKHHLSFEREHVGIDPCGHLKVTFVPVSAGVLVRLYCGLQSGLRVILV